MMRLLTSRWIEELLTRSFIGGGFGGGGGTVIPSLLYVLPTGPYSFGTVFVGSINSINVTIKANNGTFGFNVNSVSVGGAPYSLVGLPTFPHFLNPNDSFTFQLQFSPGVVGTFNDTLTVTTDAGVNNSPFTGSISGTASLGPSISVSPATIGMPDTVVSKTSAGTTVTVVNNGGGSVTVNTVALLTGTNFALSALPALPTTLATPGSNFTFTIKFSPLSLGLITDTLNITTAAANNPAVPVQGNGVQITPVGVITQNNRALISSYSTKVPVVLHKQLDSTNLDGLLTSNPSLAGSMLFNGMLWMQPAQEKALRRLYVMYENVGVGTLTATVQSLRPSQGADFFDTKTQTINIGTAAADLTERSGYFDLQIAGEILFLTISRPANSGPMSLIGFIPEWEAKGEKVEGR